MRPISHFTPALRAGLQRETGVSPVQTFSEAEQPGMQFITFGQAAASLWRRKIWVFSLAAACAVAGFVIASSQAPVYQGKALVEIQGVNENFLNRREIDPTAAEGGAIQFEPYIQTQIKILQTRTLLARTAERLHLWNNPEFQPKPSLSTRVRRLLHVPVAPGAADPHQAVLNAMTDRLTVRLSGETHIVEVLFESYDPQIAATVSNALAEEYVSQNLEKRLSATRSMGQWLSAQLQDLHQNLNQAETELQKYVTGHDLLYSSEADKDSVAQSRLRQLQTAYSTAQEARITDQSRFELVSKVPVENLSDAIDNDAIRAYQSKLTDLRQKYAETRALYTPAHYKVKQIQAEIDEVQRSLERERRSFLGRLRGQFQASQRREKLIGADLDAQSGVVRRQSANAVEYGTLRQSVETYRRLYDSTLQQAKATELASAIRANNVQVAEPSRIPDAPVRPAKPIYVAGGMLAGMILGSLVALRRDRHNRLVSKPGEISGRLGLPELGPIPSASIDLPFSVRPRQGLRSISRYYKALEAPASDEGLLRNWLELITWRQRESMLAESYRGTLASLIHSAGAGSPRVIVFTSACAGEGKTTVITNLAIALAESGRNVLLVDADRRRPRLHEIFKHSNEWGFSDYLLEDTPVRPGDMSRITFSTEVPRLRVLPAGTDRSCVPNLVDNRRAAEFIEAARSVFDAILIDTPPMLALSDARGLGRMADGVALVISAENTPEQVVMAAVDRLRDDSIHVLGTILNNWEPTRDFAPTYYERSAYNARTTHNEFAG